jgi:D-sedoheptulose 7-phosphate isomerase
MDRSIEEFRDHYADKLASGMSSFLGMHGEIIIRRFRQTLRQPRATVYLFGNGGSHAISKCLEYALQEYASKEDLRVRIETGVDIHKATLLVNYDQPGVSFVDILSSERADANDLVVVISGSGNSDNLCEVARYCLANSVPIMGLLGSAGGRLGALIPDSDFHAVPLVDQQISEDIIQSLACAFDLELTDQPEHWNEKLKACVDKLKRAIHAIPATYIAGAAQAVVDSFFTRKFTWVLGLDHPALSVCAEHVAHNLYWDGIYEVSDPPQRLIFSSPTACDFSGISNDRRRGVVEILTGVSDFREQGVALLSSLTTDQATLNSLLERLQEAGIPAFLLFGEGSMNGHGPWLTTHKTGIRKPQLQALLAQILGHMLGRVIRLKLLQRRGARRVCDLSNPTRFLVDYDLAQRRLLDHDRRL